MPNDTIKVEILEDGRLKITTDPISAANHTTAERLLQAIAQAGPTTRERKAGTHSQTRLGGMIQIQGRRIRLE